MDTVLTTQIIDEAIEAVSTYKGTADTLLQQLQNILNTLTSQDFEGDAATGYMAFFQTKATPVLDENLTQLTDGIKSILESIREQILRTVDPQLGEFNQDPSNAPAAN